LDGLKVRIGGLSLGTKEEGHCLTGNSVPVLQEDLPEDLTVPRKGEERWTRAGPSISWRPKVDREERDSPLKRPRKRVRLFSESSDDD
jgi:hypothetical protein